MVGLIHHLQSTSGELTLHLSVFALEVLARKFKTPRKRAPSGRQGMGMRAQAAGVGH